jgi:DNA (cytosine-5)-methyltransferase 1
LLFRPIVFKVHSINYLGSKLLDNLIKLTCPTKEDSLTDNLPTVSLFSGAGGLDLGLRSAGLSVRFQIDNDHACYETLRLNQAIYWPQSKIIEDSIENWSTSRLLENAGLKVGEAILVCGGPPCQPFSKSAFWVPNRWKDRKRKRPESNVSRSVESFEGLNDPRTSLLNEFVRVVREAKPAAYLLENVFGLAYKTSRPILEALMKSLHDAGYTVTPNIDDPIKGVLNAVDYEVPQIRERLFVIGAKDGVELSFPQPCKTILTAGAAIGDLDDNTIAEDERVGGKWGHLLPEIPAGDNYLHFTEKRGHPHPLFEWRSRYWSFLLKLSPTKPSWTIQGQPGPYVGPFHWRNRRLRIAEMKRLQTFPDDYQIYGNRRLAQIQLGNAVPCRLAEIIGLSIKEQLIKAKLVQQDLSGTE